MTARGGSKKTKTQAAFLSEIGSDLFAAAAERLSSAILAWTSSLSLKYLSNALGRNRGIKNPNRLMEKYRKFAMAKVLPNQNHAVSYNYKYPK